jgi:multidrug efflux pump subunit AcrA (membrane-fusion protein)
VSGKLIDPNSRSFFVEAKIPSDKDFHPNQVAMVSIQDYSAPNAVTVPLNTLQSDEKGKYVMVASLENGKLYARKRIVVPGEFYGDVQEIKSGLQAGDKVITDGYQSLYDGQMITTDQK